MNHQPLGRVESEAVGKLDAGHPSPELRADEGRAGVRGVHVKPHLLLLACGGKMGRFTVVENK